MSPTRHPADPNGTDQDITAEIEASLRAIAATFARQSGTRPEVDAERARRWAQLADAVHNGLLNRLDANDTTTEVAK